MEKAAKISKNITKMHLLQIKIIIINKADQATIETIQDITIIQDKEIMIETINLENRQDPILDKINKLKGDTKRGVVLQDINNIKKNTKITSLEKLMIIDKEHTKKETNLIMPQKTIK